MARCDKTCSKFDTKKVLCGLKIVEDYVALLPVDNPLKSSIIFIEDPTAVNKQNLFRVILNANKI